MAAGERARARAERERVAAEAARARAATAARIARRQSLTRAVTRRLPSLRAKQSGAYAARRRNQVVLVVLVVATIDLLTLFATGEWSLRALIWIVSLLAAPVLHTVLFRKA